MKEKFYFPHDYSATNDPKIRAAINDYGGMAYAIYFHIVELLHEEETHILPLENYIYKSIASTFKYDQSEVEKFISDCITEYKLLVSEDGCFYSKRVFKNFEMREETSRKKAEAGRKGGIASGKSRKTLSKTKQSEAELEAKRSKVKQSFKQGEANEASEAKEKKLKEKKEKEINIISEKTKIPTFSEFFYQFPKEYQIQEFEAKKCWDRIREDEDKSMAFELVDKYIEMAPVSPRGKKRVSPALYLLETRYMRLGHATDDYIAKREKQKEYEETQTDGDYILRKPKEAKNVLEYIYKHLHKVSKIEYQMNLAGADKLVFDYGFNAVIDKLESMESWSGIDSINSVAITCRKWLVKSYGAQEARKPLESITGYTESGAPITNGVSK